MRGRTSWMAAALAAIPLTSPAQQPKAQVKAPIRFGDVVLSNFLRAEVRLGHSATVTGPGTTVDAEDLRAKSKGRIVASRLTAVMVPKTNNQVERIEAEGSVRFTGSRPTADGKDVVNVKASGSKATLHKLTGKLAIEGPVKFQADQPSLDGKSRESLDGVADRADYDEKKRLVVLTGSVSATVVTADTPPEGSTFAGDVVTIDMSKESYVITISNESRKGSVNIRLKDREPEKP